jgi:hypothetical protein
MSRSSILGCVALLVAVFVVSDRARTASAQTAARPSTPTTNPSNPLYNPPPATNAYGTAAPAEQPLKPEEIEQVVAGIALYPDSLIAQILMASTYPLEVVQAERWAKANASLKDNALADALNKQTWDASVKSLVNFPQVLTMMSEKLDWTQKLGDAFIADQKSVLDAIQRLRAKAQASGSLKTNSEQVVNVQKVEATTTQPASQTIVIQSASPDVVYVPTYNPTVVYGGWPYPSYPPYSYYPPGYVAGTALVSFGVGVAVGAAWGNAWGNCNWGGGDVDIDVNRNTNINNNIDRSRGDINNRSGNRTAAGGNRTAAGGGRSTFQHDPSHRKGVAYRDSGTTAKYRGAGASQQSAQARNAYRGRTDASGTARGTGGTGAGRGNTAAANNRAGGASSAARNSSGTRSSGFSGAGSSSARQASSRGQSSRSSSSYSGSRGGGGGGGGSRGGGGGSRGGGGRGGGGGRR